MKTYLINLDKNPERLAFMQKEFARFDIDFERVPAVYGKALTPAERKTRFSSIRSLMAMKKRMSDAEIGVSLSHGECYRRMVAANEPMAVIFEDDVVLADSFPAALARVTDFLDPTKPQVVVFSGHGVEKAETLPPEIRSEKSLWCADAYCLTLPAAKLILKANDPVITVADCFKRWRKYFGLEIYRSLPSTVRQDDVTFKSENLVLPKSNALWRNVLWLADWFLLKVGR